MQLLTGTPLAAVLGVTSGGDEAAVIVLLESVIGMVLLRKHVGRLVTPTITAGKAERQWKLLQASN